MAQTSSEQQVYAELDLAVHDLSTRGLNQAARWAAEQLVGLDAGTSEAEAGWQPTHHSAQDPAENQPRFKLAKCHFDAKDYRRAAHALVDVAGLKPLFLRLYSLYLAGERRKEDARIEQGGPLSRVTVANPDLDEIEAALEPVLQGGAADAFCWYLHGLVQLDRQRKPEAQAALLRSVHMYPCNWSAWQALQSVCIPQAVGGGPALGGGSPAGGGALGLSLSLPGHWCREFFLAACHLELQQSQEALSKLQVLSQVFPNSPAVVSMVAQAHYSLQNYDEAHALFEDLLVQDPHRIEGMDILSNILFVKEQMAALSHLAHRAVSTDKYKPETCLVVGNYYSLKGQHEKALEYFRRALKLNRHFLAAWTLMGHEYMEVKNAAAAIDAYRHAVDLNQQDYRAWYGLGQAYELLKMPYYSIYYYRRACALRPTDGRMWCALAQSYKSDLVSLPGEAVRCFQRAIEHGDPEDLAVPELAKLHAERGEHELAERYHLAVLSRLDEAGRPMTGPEALDALLYLAGACKDSGRLDEAEQYCQRLMDTGAGPVKERAKALAREIRNLLKSAAASNGQPKDSAASARRKSKAGLPSSVFPGFPTQLSFAREPEPEPQGPATAGEDGAFDMAVEGYMQAMQVSRAEAAAALRPPTRDQPEAGG